MSGGIDSAMAAYLLCEQKNVTLWPLYIKRGATAEALELLSLRRILPWLRRRFPGQVKPLKMIPFVYPVAELKKKYPPYVLRHRGYVGRELVLAMLGVFYALGLFPTRRKRVAVATGSLSRDLYSHNRPVYWNLVRRMVELELGSHAIPIIHPLQNGTRISPANKRDVVAFALRNRFPLEMARSCISGKRRSCGVCPECVQRKEAERSVVV